MQKNRSYREILKNIFNTRKSKNSAYSLVAFSRDAGFKSYHMSDILNGRYPMSVRRAQDVAKKLKMSDILAEEFISLVTINHSKNKANVDQAEKKLKKNNADSVLLITDDTFSPISEWYFLAILEIYRNENNYRLTYQDIAQRLNIDEKAAQKAISTLLEQNLLSYSERQGYKSHQEYLAVRTTKTASHPIRKFHKQILNKSIASIDDIPTTHRHVQSFVLLLDEKEYAMFSNELAHFIKSKIDQIQESKSDGKVHAVSFQVFPVENTGNLGQT